MHRAIPRLAGSAVWLASIAVLPTTALVGNSYADPYVEFDFARSIECRDVTPSDRLAQYPQQRLVALTFPVSVRFHEVSPSDVDELTFDVSGLAAGLRVYDFAPGTQLASDVAREIETTTTRKSARSLEASLGGALPVPYAELVAHVSPTINAGMSSGETTTEKLKRLPPKQVLVVSGTTAEGRGVFYKLKPSSQTSLEGVHEFGVTFIAPAGWRGGELLVACSAHGRRKMLWMSQEATLGRTGQRVRLYLVGGPQFRQVAKPVTTGKTRSSGEPPSRSTAAKWITAHIESPTEGKPSADDTSQSASAKTAKPSNDRTAQSENR
jgi:hypothetical protein